MLLLVAAWAVSRDGLSPPEPVSVVEMSFGLCGEGGGEACVIDGDTLAIGQHRVRLTGYDAPELEGGCAVESAQARAARAELHHWLARGCFTWTGGEDPPRDRWGRELREARRGDDLLAEHMVSAGLAEEMGSGAERVEWC